MTTSGTTAWTLNRNEIITAALRKLRVIAAGATASGADVTTGAEALNALVKSWQIRPGGITLWFDVEACLFLQKDTRIYSIGATGDHSCQLSDAVVTTLSAAAATSATALTVADNDGIAASDKVGVELDNGTLHWTTQNGAPSGDTDVTLATGITSAAGSGNTVYAYTTKLGRPTQILEARIRDASGSDTPLTVHESRRDFMAITDIISTGVATDLYLSPTIGNASLYAWPVADDVTQRIIMTVRRVCEDFTGASDNFDGPPEALRALIYNLAVELAPEYNAEVTQTIASLAMNTYDDLSKHYRARDNVYFVPER